MNKRTSQQFGVPKPIAAGRGARPAGVSSRTGPRVVPTTKKTVGPSSSLKDKEFHLDKLIEEMKARNEQLKNQIEEEDEALADDEPINDTKLMHEIESLGDEKKKMEKELQIVENRIKHILAENDEIEKEIIGYDMKTRKVLEARQKKLEWEKERVNEIKRAQEANTKRRLELLERAKMRDQAIEEKRLKYIKEQQEAANKIAEEKKIQENIRTKMEQYEQVMLEQRKLQIKKDSKSNRNDHSHIDRVKRRELAKNLKMKANEETIKVKDLDKKLEKLKELEQNMIENKKVSLSAKGALKSRFQDILNRKLDEEEIKDMLGKEKVSSKGQLPRNSSLTKIIEEMNEKKNKSPGTPTQFAGGNMGSHSQVRKEQKDYSKSKDKNITGHRASLPNVATSRFGAVNSPARAKKNTTGSKNLTPSPISKNKSKIDDSNGAKTDRAKQSSSTRLPAKTVKDSSSKSPISGNKKPVTKTDSTKAVPTTSKKLEESKNQQGTAKTETKMDPKVKEQIEQNVGKIIDSKTEVSSKQGENNTVEAQKKAEKVQPEAESQKNTVENSENKDQHIQETEIEAKPQESTPLQEAPQTPQANAEEEIAKEAHNDSELLSEIPVPNENHSAIDLEEAGLNDSEDINEVMDHKDPEVTPGTEPGTPINSQPITEEPAPEEVKDENTNEEAQENTNEEIHLPHKDEPENVDLTKKDDAPAEVVAETTPEEPKVEQVEEETKNESDVVAEEPAPETETNPTEEEKEEAKEPEVLPNQTIEESTPVETVVEYTPAETTEAQPEENTVEAVTEPIIETEQDQVEEQPAEEAVPEVDQPIAQEEVAPEQTEAEAVEEIQPQENTNEEFKEEVEVQNTDQTPVEELVNEPEDQHQEPEAPQEEQAPEETTEPTLETVEPTEEPQMDKTETLIEETADHTVNANIENSDLVLDETNESGDFDPNAIRSRKATKKDHSEEQPPAEN